MYKPQLEHEKRKTVTYKGKKEHVSKDDQVFGINGSKRRRKRIALDTNTLMSDYLAMYGFKYAQNDIYIPLTVLLELDNNKRSKGKTKEEQKRAENARKAARVLLYLAESVPIKQIKNGIPLIKPGETIPHGKSVKNYKSKKGKLFFEMPEKGEIEKFLNSHIPDHQILLSCLQEEKKLSTNASEKETEFILVSGDTIMRILGLLVGLKTEKHENKALSDESFLSTGIYYFSLELLEKQKTDDGEMPRPISQHDGIKEYVFIGKEFERITINEFLIFGPPDDPVTLRQLEPEKQRQYIVIEKINKLRIRVKELKDFQYQHKVFYLNALNAEQNCFANAALVFKTPLIIGEGEAGTGKTFWALACAFQQIKDGVFPNVVLTRDAVDSGKQLGFMPGDKRTKVGNYLPGSLHSKAKLLELLLDDIKRKERKERKRQKKEREEAKIISQMNRNQSGLSRTERRRNRKKAKNKGNNKKMVTPRTAGITKLRDLHAHLSGLGTIFEGTNFIRGANFDTVVILDESQHTDKDQGKMYASRMEEGGQLVLIGNVEQDDIGIPLRDSGVAKLIEATRGTDLMCLITFRYIERGRLATRIAQYYNKKRNVL
jgi:predicted ribonuclease YlaK